MNQSHVRMHAVSIGETASGLLDGGGFFHAFAVFDRSLYAEDEAGHVLCFLRDDLEPGPLHVLCADWPDTLRILAPEGAVFQRDGLSLRSPGLTVDLSGAMAWRPAGYPEPDAANLRRGIARLRDLLPNWCRENRLVAEILLRVPAMDGPDDPAERYLTEEIRRALDDLTVWLAGGADDPPKRFIDLLGLGPGLTPTGDDVIAGSLLALHALGWRAALSALDRALSPRLPEKTNRISATHLAAALRGRGAAPFHDCVRALLAGGGGLDGILPRLSRVGHSSGWDALVGLACTLANFR